MTPLPADAGRDGGRQGRRDRHSLATTLKGAFGFLLLTAAGCTSITPQSPSGGVGSIEANTARRGTPEFCQRYAGQTYANTFQANTDTNTSDAADQQARVSGDAAYRRCLAGRTN